MCDPKCEKTFFSRILHMNTPVEHTSMTLHVDSVLLLIIVLYKLASVGPNLLSQFFLSSFLSRSLVFKFNVILSSEKKCGRGQRSNNKQKKQQLGAVANYQISSLLGNVDMLRDGFIDCLGSCNQSNEIILFLLLFPGLDE